MEKKNSETGECSFLFHRCGEKESERTFLRMLQRRGKRFKHQRVRLSSPWMLFILLTGLLPSLSSFSKVSLGAHFGFMASEASIQAVSGQVVALFMTAVDSMLCN